MGRVLAVANQKGGVAKTTTTHSLGAGLAELGERVLLVDLDPQACLTYSMGIDSDSLDRSLHDVLAGRAEAADVLVKSGDLTALPSTIDLAGAEVHLMTRTGGSTCWPGPWARWSTSTTPCSSTARPRSGC